MQFSDISAGWDCRTARLVRFPLACALALLCNSVVLAQSPAPPASPASAVTNPTAARRPVLAAVAVPPVAAVPQWAALSASQRVALQPLAATWNTLGEPNRRKWIAVAQTYPTLSPESREKLHSRMVEWAALSPKDRELARLNFAESKKVPPSDRTADWETYQALSAEERQKLASQAAKKPSGAAIAIKPAAPEKLANVPVTRHTPSQIRSEVVAKQAVDQNTLLPQTPKPAVSSSAAPLEPSVPAPE